MTGILLISDMTLLRRALGVVLSATDGIDVLADTDTAGAAEATRFDQAHVAIVDLSTRRAAAYGAIRTITALLPKCRILALTGATPSAALRGTLNSQVYGFLGVNNGVTELVTAVRRVAAGERFIEPGIAHAVLHAPRNPLTQREVDILRLTAEGLSGVDIARTLFLSEGTVRNYLSSIVRKLGARSRLDAVRTAMEANWL